MRRGRQPDRLREHQAGGGPRTWQIVGAGSSTIQGFATSISVNPGGTVVFKVKTPSTRYRIDILRLGYYQGNGARRVVSGLQPSASLPQSQPTCLNDTAPTGLIDCGNWAASASWTVPSTAVSGVYIAHLIREDATGSSHIPFVVKNSAARSDLLFQTSDSTWQAYNSYGGNSLYSCSSNCPPGNPAAYKGAAKVSYNRPFNSAVDDQGRSWLMYAEYPMIRFLEANGYDVAYTTGTDVSTAAGGALLTNHKTFLSVGHDEYWSGSQRANVEAARDAGVNLAFFSGNEMFWKTRYEPSIDGTATPDRTVVSYKDTHHDGSVDPKGPSVWTGTWQDPRFSPPGDGGRPQNALTGQLFVVNAGSTDIKVPARFAKLRFWRNTTAANLTGTQTLTLAPGQETLGYEWDVDADNGFRPAGQFNLSSTTSTTAEAFTDYGSTVKTGSTATHRMSLYRAPSGALVFGAGTVQWSFGLDDPGSTPDRTMRQATVNLFADMGAQPYAVPYAGVTPATSSTDTTAPTSTITSPAAGVAVGDGTSLTLSGTATDAGGGVVAGVEVSTDGGDTWHPAEGTTSWTYRWVAHGSPTSTIRTRAVDDTGNIETPSTGRTLDVGCTCSVWGTGSTPTRADSGTATGTEVGMKFRSEVSGKVTGVRFFKSTANTGTHVGSLWTTSGTRLASVTFANESASGWQQALFSSPVSINANTTYVVSYFAPNGHTAKDDSYFYPNPSPRPDTYSRVDSPPLHALRHTNGTVNGLEDRLRQRVPVGEPERRELLGRRRLQPDAPARPGHRRQRRLRGAHVGPGLLDRAIDRRGADELRDHPVRRQRREGDVRRSPARRRPTTATIRDLTNGTAYRFRVQAANPAGSGPASDLSNEVIPLSPVPPSSPTGVNASAATTSALVNWTAPGSDGDIRSPATRIHRTSPGSHSHPSTPRPMPRARPSRG